jgi:hypothetical protein
MIPVGWLAPRGHWDGNTLELLFANEYYPTGLQFKHHDGYPNAATAGAILVIPGRYWFSHTTQINEAIHRYKWVLAIRISDEEDWLQPEAIEHDNIRWWIQTPHPHGDYGDAYLFGVGHTPHFNNLPHDAPERPLDVFLSAQDTHTRRHDCFAALETVNAEVYTNATDSFTAGLPETDYAIAMCSAKIAPCPSGPATPDSFRTYEALEAHTIPIADDWCPAFDQAGEWPRYLESGYWRTLYPDTPMPVISKYDSLPGYIAGLLEDYPRTANRVTAWWMREKRRMARRLKSDLEALGAL